MENAFTLLCKKSRVDRFSFMFRKIYSRSFRMKKTIQLFLFFFLLLVWGGDVQAGFGISPPYVKSSKLIPGSHFEQKIYLLRSSAEEDLAANLIVEAPKIASWISFDKGTSFDLPKGELQVPMIVRIDVPNDAEMGKYIGNINVRIAPSAKSGGGVAIALGARIDVDLDVTNEMDPNFKIRLVQVQSLEELSRPWNWPIFSYFLRRLDVKMKVENTGNVETRPTRVHIEVYDITKQRNLEIADYEGLEMIPSFQTKDLVARFPTKLAAGDYWANIKIYKDKDVVYFNEMAFTVYKPGQMPGGYKLGYKPYLIAAIYLALLAVLSAVLIKIRFWRYLSLIARYLLLLPLIFVFRYLDQVRRNLMKRFWASIYAKASRYKDDQ